MKRLIIATAATALTASGALAATTLSDVDVDGNDFASIEEIKGAYPEFALEDFGDIDGNDDNRISAQEMQTPEAQQILGRYEMAPIEGRRTVVLDADSDGFISQDEMARVFADFDGEDFEMIDTNDDNRVTYQEYYAPEAQEIVARYGTSTIRDIADIDTNGDEFADFNEMVASFPGLSQVDFEEIDGNDDNRVSAQELYAPEAQEIVSRSES